MPKVFGHITESVFRLNDGEKHNHTFIVADDVEAETEEASDGDAHIHLFYDDNDALCRTGTPNNFDPHHHYHRLDGQEA